MNTLATIRNKLRSHWKKYDSKIPPSLFGQWTPSVNDRPDVYIDNPSESVILEVKAAEIVQTDTFPSKVTLRFPRVVNPRFDKNWSDALKYEELLNYYNISVNNVKKNNVLYKSDNGEDINDTLQHKHIIKKGKRKQLINTLESDLSEDLSSEEYHGKKNKKDDKYSKILPSFRDTDTTLVNKISNLFQGFQFLVLLLDDSIPQNTTMKRNLEYLIVENGGEKVQNYLSTVTHIIGNKIDLRAQNILKLHDLNILKAKWVEDSIKNKKIMKITPKYLTYANKDSREIFSKTIDKYGDSFYEEIDPPTLEGIFEGIQINNIEKEYGECLFEIIKEYGKNEKFKKLMIQIK